MKKLVFFLPLFLVCIFACSACTLPTAPSQAPYAESYVYTLNDVVQTNAQGEYRVYTFATNGALVFESITVTIAYQHLGEQPSSNIKANCTKEGNTYTLTWGMLIFAKTEVWVYDATANHFTRQGEEEGVVKKLVPVSSLTA